jgi:hypothetical protein
MMEPGRAAIGTWRGGRFLHFCEEVTERELEEAGLDAHELKGLGSGSDIYKDREGNLYEKPHGGRGPGDPIGINIKDLL